MIENLDIQNLSVILDSLNNGEQIALAAEFKLSLNSYLSDLSNSPVRSLAQVIDFNNAHPVEVSSNFQYSDSILPIINDGRYLHVCVPT